jgi:hypothetical protein
VHCYSKNLEVLINKNKDKCDADFNVWDRLTAHLRALRDEDAQILFIGTLDKGYKLPRRNIELFRGSIIGFDLPHKAFRKKTLARYAKPTKDVGIDPALCLDTVAAQTEGYSYRDLYSLVGKAQQKALSRALKDGKKAVVSLDDCLKVIKKTDKDMYALTGKKRESVDPITLRDCMPYVLGVGVAVVALFTLYKAKPAAATATAAAK